MYPLKLRSSFKDYIWGGTKLKEIFNKKSQLDIVAESWELSCHKDGQSVIDNGEFKDVTLSEFISKHNKIDVLGLNCAKFDDFPVLIKLIDAKDNLSVQVHPSNEYALKVEKEYGKTEMWYILDCEEDASLLYGFKEKITKEEFKHHIENNTLLDVCNKVNVKKGQVFFIEAGTLHAIGKGILIAEIQQNSNTTYRVYDYGRLGVDGKPRDLHIEKALDVTTLEPVDLRNYPENTTANFGTYTKTLLSKCDYFEVFKLDINSSAVLNCDETSFNSLLVIDGELELKSSNTTEQIKKGDSIFIPANLGEYILTGTAEVILTKI